MRLNTYNREKIEVKGENWKKDLHRRNVNNSWLCDDDIKNRISKARSQFCRLRKI